MPKRRGSRKPRPPSALQRALMEDPQDFDEDPEGPPAELGDGRTTTSKLAYCPALRGMCGNVDCGRCEHLEVLLWDTVPLYFWVCVRCAYKMKRAEPYWADGACELCGYESCVLMLAEP